MKMTKNELRSMIREVLHEELVWQHSEDHYSVAFKNDPEGILFIGTKAECDDFVKKIQSSPVTKLRGGAIVSKGADIPVLKEDDLKDDLLN